MPPAVLFHSGPVRGLARTAPSVGAEIVMGIAVARRAAASSTAASRLVGKVAVTMRAFDSTLATLRAVAHSVHANDGFEPWTSLKSHLADADAALLRPRQCTGTSDTARYSAPGQGKRTQIDPHGTLSIRMTA